MIGREYTAINIAAGIKNITINLNDCPISFFVSA
jgi:hypothetical protein